MQTLRFIRDNARWLAGGFLLTFFSSFGQTFFISLAGAEIRAEYDLSHGEFGGLYMIATLASAASLPFIGTLLDTRRVVSVASATVAMLAVASLSMALSTEIWSLVIVLYLLRLFGQGMMTHTAMTAMGRWFSGHRGRAVSLVTLGHQSGEAVMPLLCALLFAAIGWRQTWVLGASVLALVALPAVFLLLRESRQPRSGDAPEVHSASRHWTRAEVLRDPCFWQLNCAVMAPAFIGTAIFFHQALLIDLRGWAPTAFAGGFAVMAAVTIVFTLIAGQLIDRYGGVRLLPWFLLPLAGSCAVLALVESAWGILALMALLGVSYGIGSSLFGALWPEIYGTRHLGAVRSVEIALMVLSSAVGPGVTGALIDLGVPYPTQMGFLGLWCVAASALMIRVARVLRSR